jgi:hypothetical protein
MVNHIVRKIVSQTGEIGLTRGELCEQLIEFAKQNDAAEQGWSEDKYRDELDALVRGMIGEVRVSRLLDLNGVIHEEATIEQDLHGKNDGYIKRRDGGWYGYDAKSSFYGVRRRAEELFGSDWVIHEFLPSGEDRLLYPGDKWLRGSPGKPVMHVLPVETHFIVSADCGPDDPGQLQAETFEGSDVRAVGIAREFMDSHAASNPEFALCRLGNGSFASGKSVSRAGGYATRREMRYSRQYTA